MKYKKGHFKTDVHFHDHITQNSITWCKGTFFMTKQLEKNQVSS